jgi:hypothetical protein
LTLHPSESEPSATAISCRRAVAQSPAVLTNGGLLASVRCPYTLPGLAAHKLPVISSTPGRHGRGLVHTRGLPLLTRTRTRCRPKAARSKETAQRRLPTPVGTRRNWAMQTATSATLTPLRANCSADDYSCQIKAGQPMVCQLEYGVH